MNWLIIRVADEAVNRDALLLIQSDKYLTLWSRCPRRGHRGLWGLGSASNGHEEQRYGRNFHTCPLSGIEPKD
jgi:hypothetical protein